MGGGGHGDWWGLGALRGGGGALELIGYGRWGGWCGRVGRGGFWEL